MSAQQQHQYWNAGATEIQQLNTDGPEKDANQAQTNLKDFRPESSLSLRPDLPAFN